MRFIALMENASARPDCTCEHGLSVYIEAGGRRALFDTGASGNFAHNAEKLGVDLHKVEFAVLSHGHNDHSGGIREFLRINAIAPFYVRDSYDQEHFNRHGKDITVDRSLNDTGRIVRVTAERMTPGEGFTLVHYGGKPCVRPLDTCGMTFKAGPDDAPAPETFDHEQYLIVSEDEKRVMLTGCSHRGIVNIMNWARDEGVQTVIGGFHFKDLDESEYASRLEDAAAELLKYPVTYYSCHCTGDAPFAFLNARMGARLREFHAGMTIEL